MTTSLAFRSIRDDFFDQWRQRHPDEASTLGLEDREGRLSDPSIDAIETEARALGATLRALDALDDATLDREERLDRWSIRSWAAHEARRVEIGAHLANVEMGLLPYHLLCHFVAHVRDDAGRRVARARLGAIPAFLAAHERTLARGVAQGVAAHAGTVAWIARRELPEVVRGIAGLVPLLGAEPGVGDAARDAVAAHEAHARFLIDRVLPTARESGSIGERETRFRLATVMGLDRDPHVLVREAEDALRAAHAGLLELAMRTEMFPGARDVAAIGRALDAQYAQPFSEAGAVIPAFETLVAQATSFSRAHGLVPWDGPLAIRVRAKPPAIADVCGAQNWAAPLCAPDPHADFCLSLDHTVHPAMCAPQLAVHEAIPGHGLQSLAFARAHGDDPRPVRFLAIADDVAMARSYFGAMISIEGWATWVEDRMRELGFYSGIAELYAWNVRAIRAVRVIADIGIHLGTMSPDEAAAMLVRDAFLPEKTAASEVSRYQRIPLQALTYLTGSLDVERYLAPARARGEERAAIGALLAAGPIPPALL